MLNLDKWKKPDDEFYPVPFWFWNDGLDPDILDHQIDEMRKQHIFEFFIHARTGLLIDYMSDEWLARIEFVVKKAEKTGMHFWIYDEDNFPSGYAGGRVLEANPDFQGKHLKKHICRTAAQLRSLANQPIACFSANDTSNILAFDQALQIVDSYEIIAFTCEYTRWHPAYSNSWYVDVLNRDATEAFLNVTHREYEKHFSKYFGSVIKGFFTDEAGFYNNLQLQWSSETDTGTIVWTDRFPAYFQQKCGYDILPLLPLLFDDIDGFPAVRRDYYETTCDMYLENFLLPQKHFCEKRNMKFVGHLHCEDFLPHHIFAEGNLSKAQSGLSYAGTDRIDYNQEKINEKLISSFGHQYRKDRVLSETYAQADWKLNFTDMKQWLHYQYVRGVNMLVPHAFYASITGDRKKDCPPSQFLQNPYWQDYHYFSDYTARLSWILSQGVHIADIAVYLPIASAQSRIKPDDWESVKELDRFLYNLSTALLDNQYDFDFLNDDGLDIAFISEKNLCVNQEQYKLLIVPNTRYIPELSAEKLLEFAKNGGHIIFLETMPEIITSAQSCFDRSISTDSGIIEKILSCEKVNFLKDVKLYKDYTYQISIKKLHESGLLDWNKDLSLEKPDSHIKYLHRRIENSDIYFIVNEDDAERENTYLFNCDRKAFLLDADNGHLCGLVSDRLDGKIRIKLCLPPYASAVVLFGSFTDTDHLNAIECQVKKAYSMPEMNARPGNISSILLENNWTVRIDGTSQDSPLVSWGEMGFPYYSGEAIYTTAFQEEKKTGKRYFLVLEDVRDYAAVSVNEAAEIVRLYPPFRYDITEQLTNGENNLRIRVVNSLDNQIYQSGRISGIVGAVRIMCI